MPKDSNRAHRVADIIQRELATLVQQSVRDPRLPRMITITAVKVSRDLSYARVYFNVNVDADQIKMTSKILNNAAGFLRRELGRALTTRNVPELRFYYDESLAYGNRMTDLIDDAIARDTPDKED